jgi:hypothetical protein
VKPRYKEKMRHSLAAALYRVGYFCYEAVNEILVEQRLGKNCFLFRSLKVEVV